MNYDQKSEARPAAAFASRDLLQIERPNTIPLIAAIVPAYNEAEGIGRVLEVLRGVPGLAEVIVVDDGSTDATVERVLEAAGRDPRLRLIRHGQNQGKGQAIFTGWRATRARLLLTLDADLVGLQPEQVWTLVRPVLERRADMTLGLFRHGGWRTDGGHRATPWLTGQRCLRAELLKSVSNAAAMGYGFETALTVAARQHGWRVERVGLEGVSHPPSEAHRGFWPGAWARARMYAQIVRAWYVATGWRRVAARLKQRTTL